MTLTFFRPNCVLRSQDWGQSFSHREGIRIHYSHMLFLLTTNVSILFLLHDLLFFRSADRRWTRMRIQTFVLDYYLYYYMAGGQGVMCWATKCPNGIVTSYHYPTIVHIFIILFFTPSQGPVPQEFHLLSLRVWLSRPWDGKWLVHFSLDHSGCRLMNSMWVRCPPVRWS